ncbi:MAG: aminopeptidase, partial [Polyangiales bacterium]
MSLAAPPSLRSIAPAQLTDAAKLAAAGWDALVLVATVDRLAAFASDGAAWTPALPTSVAEELAFALKADATLSKGARASAVLPSKSAPGHRLVLAPIGRQDDAVDDVRAIFEATSAATARAVEAGARKPLIVAYVPTTDRFARSIEVAALGALASQWQPLEAREAGKSGAIAIEIGVVGLGDARAAELSAIELGKVLARDITGTEPERMAPRRVAALCKEAFAADAAAGRAKVAVSVEEDVSGYPLLAAVARASQRVERHKPCVVRLE